MNVSEQQQWQNNKIMVYYLWTNKAVEKARTYQDVHGCYCLSYYIENSLRQFEQTVF